MSKFTTYWIIFSCVFIFLFFCFNNIAIATPPIRTVDVTIKLLDSETEVEIINYQLIHIRPYGNETYFIQESPVILSLPYSEDNDTLTVIEEGYYPKSKTLIFNEDKYVIFNLDPLPPTLVNIYIENTYNDSLKDATVNVNAVNEDESFSGKTDENGLFSFQAKLINYEITVTAEGYSDGYETIVVDHNVSETDFIITLTETPPTYYRMVYLTIKDPEGKTIENATVNIRTRYSDDINLTNTTGENGLVTFELTSNDYDIIVSTEEYGTEKFGLWIGNYPTAWEGYLQMGTSESGEKPFTPTFKAIDFPPTLIIFIVVVVLLIAILIFKTMRKSHKKKSEYSKKSKDELKSDKK